MDFTPLIPCGRIPSVASDVYIATVCLPSRISIRSTTSLSIKRVINIEPLFNLGSALLQWDISRSDQHHRLLAADSKSVLAYDVDDENWSLVISEGLGGVRHAEWSDTGEAILVWAEFQLKLTVWSIFQSTGTILPNPKLLSKGFQARPGAHTQAVLLQRTSHDSLALIDTSGSEWLIQKTFAVATSDAQGVQWSPDGEWLAVWDNMIDYRILIYTPDGRLVRTFVAYEIGLGIKTVNWSPSMEYLAIGSYDDKVRLLNTTSFSPCIELSHAATIRCERTAVWRQVQSGGTSRYDAADQAISPPYVKPSTGDTPPRHGVGILSFSPNGYFLATRSDSMPTTLWIWSLREFSPVAILVNTNPVRNVQWTPSEAGELIFSCQGPSIAENNAIYLWNIDWSSPRIISIPKDGFEVRWFNLMTRAAECGVLIGSGDSFTIGYTVPETDSSGDMSVLQEEGETTVMDKSPEDQETNDLVEKFDPQSSIVIHALSEEMPAIREFDRRASML